MADFLKRLVEETPGLVLDSTSKSFMRFLPKAMDVPLLLEGSGWVTSGRMLLFQLENFTDGVKLKLYLGPGPMETRRQIFDLAISNQATFKAVGKSLNRKWNALRVWDFFKRGAYEDASMEDAYEAIRARWGRFLEYDLPEITELLLPQLESWQAARSGFATPLLDGSGG